MSHVPPNARTLLDLGAAEGYVGEMLGQGLGVAVTLADVVALNRTPLPFVLLDEDKLPFADGTFDVTVLAYVLHHARNAEFLMTEARRVTQGRVLVLESVVRSAWDLRVFEVLDRAANRLRSAGAMDEYLHPRSVEEWISVFATQNTLTRVEAFGRWPHRQALFVLDRRE